MPRRDFQVQTPFTFPGVQVAAQVHIIWKAREESCVRLVVSKKLQLGGVAT